jgi:hypothetical protein
MAGHAADSSGGTPSGQPREWGVFLNDFDQFIHGRGGWAERAGLDTGPVGANGDDLAAGEAP